MRVGGLVMGRVVMVMCWMKRQFMRSNTVRTAYTQHGQPGGKIALEPLC